jgi:hypothetical protein
MTYEFEILFGSILAVIIILIVLAIALEKLFPKNKISETLERIAEWIKDSFRI